MLPQSIRFKCIGGSNGACFCQLTEEITSPEKIYVAATCPQCSVKQISCIYCGITVKLSDDVKVQKRQIKNLAYAHRKKHSHITQPATVNRTVDVSNVVHAKEGLNWTDGGDNVGGGIDNISNEVNDEEGPVDADVRNDSSGDHDSDMNSEGGIHSNEGYCFSDNNDDGVSCTGDDAKNDESIKSNSATYESISHHDDKNDQDILSMWALHSRFNAQTNTYFRDDYEWYKHHGEEFGGLRCLVFRSLYTSRPGRCAASILLTTVMLNMLNLLIGMSSSDKDKLAMLISGIVMLITTSIGDLAGSIDIPPIPVRALDLRKVVVGSDDALMEGLPCEEVHVVDDYHVAVTLDSVIDLMMAQGVPLSFMVDENGVRDGSGINGSAAATALFTKLYSIVEEAGRHDPARTAYGYLIFWSDSFLTAWVKQKDNSCWCMTVTVAPPKDHNRSIFHTHCIALGRKEGDHNKVIVQKLDELEDIRKGKWRYDGREKRWVFTSFDIIVYMADRPERHEILRTLNHSGLVAKRFRYAALTDAAKLPSCDTCFGIMLLDVIQNRAVEGSRCRRCCNWDYSADVRSAAWKSSAPLPEKYPRKMTTNCDADSFPENREVGHHVTYIKPQEQSFEWLKKGAELALEEFANGTWTAPQTKSYLNSMGVATETCDRIVDEGKKRQQGRKRKAEELYTPEDDVLPAIWSKGYDMEQWIECPMHLIFLGITKALIACFEEFMKGYGHKTNFEQFINAHLNDIAAFRLDYCAMKKIPTTQWVSENYLALARIFPWVYGLYCINYEVKDGSRVHFPELFKQQVKLMQQLLNAYHSALSALMTRESTIDFDLLEKRIKIFLTMCRKFGVAIEDNFWASKANFYSLLNLTSQIEKYGPLRDYWDGDYESSIQLMRPELKRVRRSMYSYFKHKLQFARRKKSLRTLNEMFYSEKGDNIFDRLLDPDDEPPISNWYASYYRFSSREEIQARLNDGLILCGFFSRDAPNTIYIAFGNGRSEVTATVINYDIDDNPIACCGLLFCSMQLAHDANLTKSKEDIVQLVADGGGYCLLLPYIKRNNEEFGGQYTIVTDEWEALGRDGSIAPSELNLLLFEHYFPNK